ncbi:hypothetical protein U27_05422 [Candidatus Vecturithrix granuli]|uniref:Uncharacterized protein n=1 Tax=Vecturithrix granuli TaxID=1499967 RepID=A0A081C1J3_VECG1|nr:hypothetical protein U27_05422 [Candidatus Vecturithrix granuli]
MPRQKQHSNRYIILMKTIIFLLCLNGMLSPFSLAGAQEIHHEITSELQFSGNDSTQDHYVVNDEAFPTALWLFESDVWRVMTSYSFFFKPLDASRVPHRALQHFYSHPTLLRVYIAVQPETETTYTFTHRDQNYRSQTLTDDRAREAGLEFEYYLWDNTGVIFLVNSVKNEEMTSFSTSLDLRGRGIENEIRRYYGIGVSHYWREQINLRAMFTWFDFEYAAVETTWSTTNTLLLTEAGREADTDGCKLRMSGEYIWNNRIGVQAFYLYAHYNSHSNILSSFYENFPGFTSYYDDEMTSHVAGLQVSAYVGKRITAQIGGRFGVETFDQVYETDQVVSYNWDLRTLNTSVEYSLNQHWSVQLGYEYAIRDADAEIGHPESEPRSSTTSQIRSDTHTAFAAIIARF